MPATADLYTPDDTSQTSSMTITELNGKRRIVMLRRSGMPHMDAAWGVHQNSPTTWYPGNPEGSQQVLGGQLVPSEWEGTWKRTLLGRFPCLYWSDANTGTPIINPDTLADLFESICLEGARVQVKWRSIVREGRMVDFTRTHGRSTDISWKAKFEWINRGQNTDRRVLGVRGGGPPPSLLDGALEAELAANMEPTRLLVSTRPDKLPKGTPSLTLGQIGGLLDAPGKMLKSFCRDAREFAKKAQSAAALIQKAKNLPYDLANTALNEAENMIAIANNTVDMLSRESPEKLAVKKNAADVVRNASYFGSATRQATILAGKCADIRSSVQKVVAEASGAGINTPKDSPAQGSVLRVHAVKQGDTLISISAKYYGTPDHAYDIAKANHIAYPSAPDPSGTSIGGHRTIIIPVLNRKGS